MRFCRCFPIFCKRRIRKAARHHFSERAYGSVVRLARHLRHLKGAFRRAGCAGNKKLSAPAAFVPVLHAAICTGTGSDAYFSCVRAKASRASDPEGIAAGGHAFVSAGASAALLVSASYGAVLPFVSRPPGPQAAPECGLSRCAGGSGAWLLFSALFSVYVNHFAKGLALYGSLTTMVLTMLWVYACVSIVFYGAFLNRLLLRLRTGA